MRCSKDHNGNDKGSRRPQQGRPLQGGEIRKEGQGKEEGSASAEEVCRAAVLFDDRNAAFLLMAEVMVAIAIASLLSFGAGTTTIILGLLLLGQRPVQ
jgi:hypothetical protein